eukprot:Gregarina_sp_Poly_1__8930@NODE_53_length_17536_cov_99_000057_g45_i0_p2_GENE_NODE_53_length_17536_cov_99_000057_g45_i0NODE_53_length_17536_cov_99_000057_g45_i0_p2_ORF_typecomplete_len816_score116_82PDEase_I/PF00233_19/5_3e71_NODE_53_length_17536_cov_99_000057_g45_i027615208
MVQNGMSIAISTSDRASVTKSEDARESGLKGDGSGGGVFRRKAWQIFTGIDDPQVRHSLHLFPLRFKEAAMEKAYTCSLQHSYRLRSVVIASFLALSISIYWLTFGLVLRSEAIMLPYSIRVTAFHVLMAFALLCALSIYVFHYYTPRHIEVYIYLLTLPALVSWEVWLIAAIVKRPNFNIESYEVSLKTFAFKMWTDNVLFSFHALLYIVYDQLMQTRAPTSLAVHILLFVFYAVFRAISLWQNMELAYGIIRRAFISTEVIQIFALGGTICLAYLGRAQKEIVERIHFVKVKEDQRKLKSIQEAHKRQRSGRGETVIETLIQMLRKCQYEVRELAFEISSHGDPRMFETDEVLRQCIDILMNTDQLFSMQKTVARSAPEDDLVNLFAGNVDWKAATLFARATGTELCISEEEQQLTMSIKPDPKIVPTEAELTFNFTELSVFDIDFMLIASNRPHFLRDLTLHLLRPHLAACSIDIEVMAKFLGIIEEFYLPNPYHNACHGATVAYMVNHFVNNTIISDSLLPAEITQVTVAGACHDVGHPGKNNNFFMNEGKLMALIYNDTSILESYHSFLTFRITQMGDGQNIFRNMSSEQFRDFRKRIVELILATDMAQHFSLMSKFRIRRKSEDFDLREDMEDRWSALRICMKAADLSHAFIKWDLHFMWSLRIQEEFYQQGDLEAASGLPISPLCNRIDHPSFAKSQGGFIQFVVQPLAEELGILMAEDENSGEDRCMARLQFNKARWEELRDGPTPKIEMPAEILRMKTADVGVCASTLLDLMRKTTLLDPPLSPSGSSSSGALGAPAETKHVTYHV